MSIALADLVARLQADVPARNVIDGRRRSHRPARTTAPTKSRGRRVTIHPMTATTTSEPLLGGVKLRVFGLSAYPRSCCVTCPSRSSPLKR